MPFKPKVPCRHPGCPELVEPGRLYCEKHLSLHPEVTRPAAKRGYTRRWQKVSKAYLQAHPLCAECMKNGRYVRATVSAEMQGAQHYKIIQGGFPMITAHIDFPASPNVPDTTESIIRIPSEPEMSTEMDIKKPILYVPLKEKWLLTIPEAAAYFGVGQNRIADLALRDGCKFVVFVGSKKLIKRKKFEEFLDEQYAI